MTHFLISKVMRLLAKNFLADDAYRTFSDMLTGYNIHRTIENFPELKGKIEGAWENIAHFFNGEESEDELANHVSGYLMRSPDTFDVFQQEAVYYGFSALSFTTDYGSGILTESVYEASYSTGIEEVAIPEDDGGILEEIIDSILDWF